MKAILIATIVTNKEERKYSEVWLVDGVYCQVNLVASVFHNGNPVRFVPPGCVAGAKAQSIEKLETGEHIFGYGLRIGNSGKSTR